MLTVHKFTIEPQARFSVELPESFKVVGVEVQADQRPVFYAVVETTGIRIRREFFVFPTGVEIPRGLVDVFEHLGVLKMDGNLYFHLFGPRTGGSFSHIHDPNPRY